MAGCPHKAEHTRLLRALLSLKLSRGEMEKLHSMVCAIARDTITRLRNTKNWWLENIGLSDEDVASDACAELLACDGKKLRDSMLRMGAEDDEAAHLCNCLHGILERRLPQEFSRILVEYDPVYGKLLRALRDHARRAHDVSVRDAYGGRVYSSACSEALRMQPYMPLQELARSITPLPTVRRVGAPMNLSVKMLYSCLSALIAQDEYRREVHEHDVMWLTIHMLANGYEVELLGNALTGIAEAVLRSACDSTFERTRAWMNMSYVATGKLTGVQADQMLQALKEYVLPDAQKQEGDGAGLASCLRRQGLDVESCGRLFRIAENVKNNFESEVRKLATRGI
jgi:hypothetical protein